MSKGAEGIADRYKLVTSRRRDIGDFVSRRMRQQKASKYALQKATRRPGSVSLPTPSRIEGVIKGNVDYKIDTLIGMLHALDCDLAVVDRNTGELLM